MSLTESTHRKDGAEGAEPAALALVGSNRCDLPLPTRIGFIGNYLPRECGIATFTADLGTALVSEEGWRSQAGFNRAIDQ